MMSFIQGAITRDTDAHRLRHEGDGAHLAAGRPRGVRPDRAVLPRQDARADVGRRLLAEGPEVRARKEPGEPARPARPQRQPGRPARRLPHPQGVDSARADAAPAARRLHHPRSGDEPGRDHRAVPRAVPAGREEAVVGDRARGLPRDGALGPVAPGRAPALHGPGARGEIEFGFRNLDDERPRSSTTPGSSCSGGCWPPPRPCWPPCSTVEVSTGRPGSPRSPRAWGAFSSSATGSPATPSAPETGADTPGPDIAFD